MIKITSHAALCCIMLVAGLAACTSRQPSALKYRFASQEEGQQLKLVNTSYFEALTQNDIDWKLQSSGQSLEEFKAVAAEQIREFSEEEKKAISKVMDFIEGRAAELGFRLPVSGEIIFIKTDMGDEGHMGGYTQKNEIYLSADEAEYLARAFQADPEFDADYLEYLIHFGRGLISHEVFHCLTRNNAEFREAMYGLIGFKVMDHDVAFGPTVRNLLLQNPDVEHNDCWGEFTIDGQKRRCALVAVYPGTYAEAAADDPDANFYACMQSVLVPLDAPDTMIPIEDVPGFYDVMGRNTDYICVPEECLAENFSFLISYGFFGRYDLTLDTRKVLFVPYATPALIRSIHATLLEHFPGR